MLKIENLHKIYGKYHALSGLDMTVKEGALYGFVGPNGAGKTTAIKIMTGLLQAEEGSVLINGKDALADPDQLKSCIGYEPDFFGVYDNLTVGEYMSFFASCYQLDGLVARKRYTALLEQVGLEDKLDFYVDGLSRGMKQRLCLARALIHDPQILILDEPTSGLDPRTRVEFKEILEDLKFAGKTILISSHVLSELSEMCTDTGIIDQGRMILEGNIQDILSRVNASNPLVISVYSNMEKALSILKSHPCVRTISMREKDICVRFTGDAQDEAILLQQLIDSFDADAKIVERKERFVLYLKEGSQIVDMLNVMEAYVALMQLENVRILKEMRNSVNRKVNCETANINKTVNAAVKQMEDIKKIRETIGFEDLPVQLAEIAQARLDHPDATLKELGTFLDPPVGKSGVNHRLHKLAEIAENL